jgi:hydrogenase nickel incorporation protein HypA/HybF
MHEYPVAQRIIQVAEETSKKNGAAKIKRINIVAGELSGFIGESMQMYFDILSKGSAAEGALINVKSVKPMLECRGCGIVFEMKDRSFNCPSCGKDGSLTQTGREFYIESIDLET